MSMALAIETPNVEYVKERLEMAGYALQCLPGDGPRGHKSNWPDVPRTSIETWILQLQAEQDVEVKRALAEDANRIRQHATREQIAAFDEVLDWIYVFIKDRKTRGIVLARSMPFGKNKHKASYRKLGRYYGVSHEYARILYEKGIEIIVGNLNA